MYTIAGCFSILPASELVPGDIVEVTGMCVVSHLDAVFLAMVQNLVKLLNAAFLDVCMLNSGL